MPVQRPSLGSNSLSYRTLFVELHNRDHRTATMRALMHGVDRDEHGWIAERRRRYAANCRLGMPVVMNIGIVEHDLPPTAQDAPAVGLALHEAIDDASFEVFRPRPFRQLNTGVADRIVDSIDIQRVAHDRMADAVTAAGAGLVAQQYDLRLGQFHAR